MKKLTSLALLAMALSFVSCEQRTELKDHKTTTVLPENTVPGEARKAPQVIEIETEEETPDEIDVEEEEFEVDDEDDGDQGYENEKPAVTPKTQINVRTAPINRDELRQSWREARDQLHESGRLNGYGPNSGSNMNQNSGTNQMNSSGNFRQMPNQQRSNTNW
ncbi:hypothetical protein [Criblamydia sequanensis]|uniref:Secreted protein n=1 Tax=Candidatus Criblamydia sequanensis CRIB-18 TaxID=1437425 RepID=A0A090CY54_9BACT|nr:hypothetical protein [Criblamydia sequanensis]CDR33297.1 putative secreted protein [Criblamydia sequanensis CRIB-18]